MNILKVRVLLYSILIACLILVVPSSTIAQKKKKDKVINKCFALGWEDVNGDKKAQESEIKDYRGEKKAVFSDNETPCYVIRMPIPNSVLIKKDGEKIELIDLRNEKSNKAFVVELPNEGLGIYTVGFGVLRVKYEIVKKQ